MGREERPMHVWTVNTESDLELCLRMGVGAVITDRPAYMLDLLDAGARSPGRTARTR